MGSDEAASPSKSDKASSPAQVQQTIQSYPDWPGFPGYYGPGVAMPPPYFTAAVASGHASHPYMWSPQPLMSPCGTPYAAVYPPGVFPHLSVPIQSHPHCQGFIPSPSTSEAVVMATPLSIATPAKSSSRKGRGLLKRLKRLDGNAVSVSNGNADNTSGSAVPCLSQSGECSAEGSSDRSDENKGSDDHKTKKGSSKETLILDEKGKAMTLDGTVHVEETNATDVKEKPVDTFSKPEAKGIIPSIGEVKLGAPSIPLAVGSIMPSHDGVSVELWSQDERELKLEKRKQSNRESARRSRLRKQAESEVLALKAGTLNEENETLRSEISCLKDNAEKLRLENSALKEKLKNIQLSQAQEAERCSDKIELPGSPSVCTENLLIRINNSSLRNSDSHWESEAHENSSGKLRQLFDSSPRTDAVAAS